MATVGVKGLKQRIPNSASMVLLQMTSHEGHKSCQCL